MRWWFTASDHQVLLAKFQRNYQGNNTPAIILEKWVEVWSESPRPGATTTRAVAAMQNQPVKQQVITITQDPTTNPVSYQVASGALVLDFSLL